jgi:hypothetical protein
MTRGAPARNGPAPDRAAARAPDRYARRGALERNTSTRSPASGTGLSNRVTAGILVGMTLRASHSTGTFSNSKRLNGARNGNTASER